MDRAELHEVLVKHLGLVPEPIENPVSRTYFHARVDWHPHRSTRVFRVMFDPGGEPSRIQLCASSDNNNTVLVSPPFISENLIDLAAREIELIEARR